MNKSNYLFPKVIFGSLFLAQSLLSQLAFAQNIDQVTAAKKFLISANIPKQNYSKLNNSLKTQYGVPYFYMVPEKNFLPLPHEMTDNHSAQDINPLVLVNLVNDYAVQNTPETSNLGWRMIYAQADKSQSPHLHIAQKLAESGLVQTGDILLSARPRLVNSLPYVHAQLGVTHAGIALVKEVQGKKTVFNLDMPFDYEMLEGALGYPNSNLDSKHYSDYSMVVHVIRARGLTDTQKENIQFWLETFQKHASEIYDNGDEPVANKMIFNRNYLNPAYNEKNPENTRLNFIKEVAQLALGIKNGQKPVIFCSEFAWIVHSLKNCHPVKNKHDFTQNEVPSCVTPMYRPLPMFSEINSENAKTDLIGVSDIVSNLVKVLGFNGENRISIINTEVFNNAKGESGELSSAHRETEKFILTQNPMFYELMKQYYHVSIVPENLLTQDLINQKNTLKSGFNSFVGRNYSPTAFLAMADMPNHFNGKEITEKVVDYVFTLQLLPADYPQFELLVNEALSK